MPSRRSFLSALAAGFAALKVGKAGVEVDDEFVSALRKHANRMYGTSLYPCPADCWFEPEPRAGGIIGTHHHSTACHYAQARRYAQGRQW